MNRLPILRHPLLGELSRCLPRPAAVTACARATRRGASSRQEFQARPGSRRAGEEGDRRGFAQIRAEAAKPKTDLWWGGTGDPFLQAAEIGLLGAYRPAYLNDLQALVGAPSAMGGNFGRRLLHQRIGFGWNEDVSRRSLTPPKCWADLMTRGTRARSRPRTRARAAPATRSSPGSVQLMGEDAAFDYLKKLHGNITRTRAAARRRPRASRRARSASASASSSASRASASRASRWSRARRRAKARATRSAASRWSRAARTAKTAKRYYDWLMSPAGQSLGAKAARCGTRPTRPSRSTRAVPDARLSPPRQVRLRALRPRVRAQAPVERWEKEVNSLPR